MLCESCHSHKTYRRKAMDLRVYEIVEAREGALAFNELRKIDEGITICPEWQYLWYHQEQGERLDKLWEKVQSQDQ